MNHEAEMAIPQHGVVDLRALFRQVVKSTGLIAFLAVVFGFFAFLFAVRPIPYEVHATLNVAPAGMGTVLSSTLINIDTELGRIRSWTTVERVIEKMNRYGLVTLQSAPDMPHMMQRVKYFLKTGKKHKAREKMPIHVDELRFPSNLNGSTLYLRVTGVDSYVVERPSGEKLFDGVVGDKEEKGGGYILHVSEIDVPQDSVFAIRPLSQEAMVESVLTSLKAIKRSADKTSSLIDIRFFSKDPYFAVQLVDGVVKDYVDMSYQRVSASAQRAIDDLNKELEAIGKKLDESEAQLGEYMKGIDVADVEAEMRGQLELRLSLEQSLRQVQLQKAQLKQVYTKGHPAMKAAKEKEAQLLAKLERVRERLAQLPEIKGELFTLTRKVDQFASQYSAVLKQYTQLKVDASAVNNYASVVNLPRIVRRNLRNKAIQIVVLGVMMGVIIALGIIVLRSNLRGNLLKSTDQLEDVSGISITDIDPGVMYKKYSGTEADDPGPLDDIAAQFSYLAANKKNNITLVTADKTTPCKSRLALKLARRFAAQNGKVLLIDANVKSSNIANYIGITGQEGFANAMVGKMPGNDIIHRVENSDLYYMPPGNPGMSIQILRDFERFDYLLEAFGKLFDRIIIDLPSQAELPFWQTLITRTGTTIHFLQKGDHTDHAYTYLHTVSELAKAQPETLHEVVLHAQEDEPNKGLLAKFFKRA